MTDTLVQTHALTKRFGRVTAVEDLHLEVKEGDLFGFLGPNGSGKTTTVRMLLGLVYPTSGEMQILGSPMPRDAKVVLPNVGALIEGPAFYPHLSGIRNLALFDAAGRSGNRKTRKRDAIERFRDPALASLPIPAPPGGIEKSKIPDTREVGIEGGSLDQSSNVG